MNFLEFHISSTKSNETVIKANWYTRLIIDITFFREIANKEAGKENWRYANFNLREYFFICGDLWKLLTFTTSNLITTFWQKFVKSTFILPFLLTYCKLVGYHKLYDTTQCEKYEHGRKLSLTIFHNKNSWNQLFHKWLKVDWTKWLPIYYRLKT